MDKNTSKELTVVWIFNIGAENIWHKENIQSNDKLSKIVTNRIEELNLLIARSSDIVILRSRPNKSYLEYLKGLGFPIPNILVVNNTSEEKTITELLLNDSHSLNKLKEISKKTITLLVPYAITELEEKVAEQCGMNIWGPDSHVGAMINDKIIGRKLAEKLELNNTEGEICRSALEIKATANTLHKKGYDKLILKSPCNASGQGIFVSNKLREIERYFQYGHSRGISKWILEGWYEDALSLNCQICISTHGKVEVFSIKEQVMDGVVYKGSLISKEIYENNKELINIGEIIGKYLFENYNYIGVLGVDFIKRNCNGSNQLYYFVEINARFTLSTYLVQIERMFKDKVLCFRYIDLFTHKELLFEELLYMLNNDNLLYNGNRNIGVIPLVSETLPKETARSNEILIGRMFILIIGENSLDINILLEKIYKMIREKL